MANVNVGLDPEFVLMRNGKPVSAPLAMKSGPEAKVIKTRFGLIFPDNANLELAINPSTTRGGFIGNIKGILSQAAKVVDGYAIHAIPSIDFPKDQLEHPICKKFACDPDFDAYEVKMNEIDEKAIDSTFRSAGGHVHVGYGEGHDYLHSNAGRIDTVKTFEAIAGIPSLLLDHSPESLARRNLYGAPGAHRPKEYGVECRSLSNFWLQRPELAGFIFDATQTVGKEMQEQNLKINLDQIPQIIRAGNINAAKEVFTVIGDTYSELQTSYEQVMEFANLDKMIPIQATWQL